MSTENTTETTPENKETTTAQGTDQAADNKENNKEQSNLAPIAPIANLSQPAPAEAPNPELYPHQEVMLEEGIADRKVLPVEIRKKINGWNMQVSRNQKLKSEKIKTNLIKGSV